VTQLPEGNVKLSNDAKGYGFIRQDGDNRDAFVRYGAEQNR
jgi:cold shock CspA family protein